MNPYQPVKETLFHLFHLIGVPQLSHLLRVVTDLPVCWKGHSGKRTRARSPSYTLLHRLTGTEQPVCQWYQSIEFA